MSTPQRFVDTLSYLFCRPDRPKDESSIAILRAEQEVLLLQSLPLTVFPIITSTLVAMSLLSIHSPVEVVLWYILYVPIPIILLALFLRRRPKHQSKIAPQKPSTGRLSRSADRVSLFSGIFWGLATPLFGHQNSDLLLFMSVVQIAHASGIAQIIAPLPRQVFRFAAPALLPTAIMLLTSGELLLVALGLLSIAIFSCLMFSSFSSARELRRRALSEARAKRAEALLRTAIDAMPDAFAVYGFNGEMILQNTNHKIWDMGFITPVSDSGERVTQTKAGQWIKHNWNLVPEVGTLTIHSDITTQKHREQLLIEAREQAQIASEAQSRFLSRVSHELRTPLNSVLGFSELLGPVIRKKMSWNTVKEYVDYIQSSGKHLLSLVDDIIDYTNLGDESDQVNVSVVELNKVLIDAVKIGKAKANVASNHKVLVRLHHELKFLRTDERLLERIIANVISNAIKFSSDDSKIAISTSYSKTGDPVLTIRDFGQGMTAKQMKNAFSVFYQADDSHKRFSEGTGMGLAVVKRLADLLNIDIRLASKIGHGTAVIMTFDLSCALAPATPMGDAQNTRKA